MVTRVGIARRRQAAYWITGIGLTVGLYFGYDAAWKGSPQLHTVMEAIATLLAVIVGAMALVRYYSKRESIFLLVGAGFLGTGFLDGYHAIVTSTYFRPMMPSDLPALIPWSWVASRLFLSAFLVLSWIIWIREERLGTAGRVSERAIYIGSVVFSLTSFLFFAFAPLPRAYYPEFFFHRPEEFIPALLFLLALVGYLKKGQWRNDVFEHWLVLSLIVGFISQAAFMSHSGMLFDYEFDIAHTLKKVSYICVLCGLLLSMYAVFQHEEKINRELEFQKLSLDEHAIVSITDVDGNITYANENFCRVSGFDQEELLGKNHSLIKSEEHSRKFYDELWQTITNGKVWRGEIKNRKKGGGYYWVNATIIPFLDDSGKPFQYVAIRNDISITKKIEEDLRESEERFRSMSNSSSVAMILAINHKGEITYWNRAAKLTFGYDEAEILGRPVTDIMPERFREDHLQGLQRVIKSDEQRILGTTVELVALKKDGEEFEIELSLGTWKHGEEKFFSAVIHDISERKRTEKELIENQKKAEAANLAKSNFLSTMSHEIRTPLNGVLGLAQLLTDTNLDPNQRKKVDAILSSGQTLLAIINDVLDMSRIEAGGVELESRAFSLRNLLSVVATPFQSLADDKGLELNVNDTVDPGLVIKGDSVRLRQVLWNLLSNAIKFTASGSVTLLIDESDDANGWSTKSTVHMLHFSVEDTGAGIASDRIDAIFDAFTQEDSTTTRKHGGTGLGLSIVKQLTDLMGGTISVKSELGIGTRFDVYIPFDEATEEEAEGLSLQDIQDNIQKAEPLNVLIAEDNEVNAVIARAFLEKSGHRVIHVENGRQAVVAAKEGWADLVLMDIHMPEMNGIDATKAIRASDIGVKLPIIGVTAEAFAERHELFIKAGMDGVLTKPFTEQQLADTLAKYRRNKDSIVGDSGSLSTNPADVSGHSEKKEHIEGQNSKETAASGETTPVGDEEKLEAFRQQINSDTVTILLGKAQKSLLSRMEELRQGLETSDSDSIREAAHSIKGACGSLFAVRVSELAATIEKKYQDIDAVKELMPEFEDVAKNTVKWWQKHSL